MIMVTLNLSFDNMSSLDMESLYIDLPFFKDTIRSYFKTSVPEENFTLTAFSNH